MTIYRNKDKKLSVSDKTNSTELNFVDRDISSIKLFEGYVETSWHNHETHQLLYAEKGVLRFHTENRAFLLPANHGIWIPATRAHSVDSATPTLKLWAIYLRAHQPEDEWLNELRVFPISPLAHEMIVFAGHWIKTDEMQELKSSYFETIRLLAKEWCKQTLSLELPISRDPLMQEVTSFILTNLGTGLNLVSLSERFGISQRTLIRYFQKHLGMTFGVYLQAARVAKAAELLVQPSASVTDVAYAVGYRSLSSFIQAFQKLVGQTPFEYMSGKKKRMFQNS